MSTYGQMKRAHNPFVNVKKWRARDNHTGIGKDAGVAYTYEHVAAAPAAGATVYRVETYIPFEPPTPLHRDVYYVPAAKLDEFFNGWREHATVVVDVRPLTVAEALEELRAFPVALSRSPGDRRSVPSRAQGRHAASVFRRRGRRAARANSSARR